VSALTVPAQAGVGTAIVVTDTTTNQGAGAVSTATATKFYLSTKIIFDSSALLLQSSHAVPNLPAGAASTAAARLTLQGAEGVVTRRNREAKLAAGRQGVLAAVTSAANAIPSTSAGTEACGRTMAPVRIQAPMKGVHFLDSMI
jgi:hypothetical protein